MPEKNGTQIAKERLQHKVRGGVPSAVVNGSIDKVAQFKKWHAAAQKVLAKRSATMVEMNMLSDQYGREFL